MRLRRQSPCLVVRITGDARNQFRRRYDLRGIDARIEVEYVAARLNRHHDFFQRGIAGTLAKPLMVHSTWRAPFITADNEFAHCQARSLWQCVDQITLPEFGTRAINCLIARPKLLESNNPPYRHIQVLAPALITASNTRTRKSISERTAFLGGEFHVISIFQRHFTAFTARSTT